MTASLSKGLPKRKQQPLRKSRRKLIRYGWTGRLLPLVLISFLASPGRAQEPLPAWSTDSCKAWWTQNSSPAQWSTAADTLDRRLAAIYQKGGASVFSLPDFQGWMEHLEWVRLGLQDPTLLSDPRRIQRFISLGEDSTISHLLVEKIEPRDVKQAALENLLHLAETQAADLHEYAALAVAYCLVFDEPFPDYWPHRQVPQSAVPIGDLDIAQRFAFYVQANRNKQTALDLSQLPFEALKYLVDSEVSLSELQYGQKSTIPYDDFGKAFFSISYDEGRLSQNGGFTWSYPTYTLDDIKTRGGICVDQAYYAFILGKGRGIPTIYFTGLGTDGGHAWFGYLERSGKWNLDCGRYASQNYPKGYALDPQTWQEIKDTTLQDLAKNGGTNPNYLPARTALAWARLHVSSPQDEQAFDDARSLMPEMAESWQAEADFMAGASTIDLQAKKDFFQQWIAQFTGYPDMKVEGQKRLEDLLKKSNDPEAAAVGQDIVLENRSTGFDLGIEGSSNAIIDKLKAGDWDGADLDFKTSVRDFNAQGGSTFYYQVIRPYVAACVHFGHINQAAEGLRFTSDRMTFNDGSIVSDDYTALVKRVTVLKSVIDAMQSWLAEIDDANYDQSWNDLDPAAQAGSSSGQWDSQVSTMRGSLGRCTSRTLASAPEHGTGYTSTTGQKMSGIFYLARFNSTFDSLPHATETVCFKADDDGKWRAVDYKVAPTGSAPEAASN